MTTGAEPTANDLFIDTNVLIYANINEAPEHEAALNAITQAREAGRTLWISRQVLREYLVTLTRPQTFQDVPRAIVLKQIQLFIEQFTIADDTDEVTRQLLQLMADTPIGGKKIHDANIVATMLAHNIPSLLTHNRKDFERFENRIAVEPITSS